MRPLWMQRKRGIPLLLLGALLGWGVLQLLVQQPLTVDYVVAAKTDVVETLLATGQVVGESRIPLSFGVSGVVSGVNVREGDTVDKGTILMALQNDTVKSRVKQQEYDLQSAQLQLQQVVSDLQLADEGVNQLEIRRNLAQEEAENMRILFQEGAISRREQERTDAELELAESALRVAEHERVRLGNAGDVNRVSVARARERLAETRLALADTVLEAPVSGVLISVDARPGQFMQPGQAVAELVPTTERTKVEVQVEEDSFGQIFLGQQAVVTSSAYPDAVIDAEVTAISSLADSRRGTFSVRLALDQGAPPLLIDSAVSVQLVAGRRSDVLVVPQSVLRQNGASTFVFREDGGRALAQPVSAQDLGNGSWVIISGLEEGDIILRGVLTDGQSVRLTESR